MADYSQKANDFRQSLKKGVPKNASQKGLADYKAKMANKNKSTAGQGEQRVRARGGITRD